MEWVKARLMALREEDYAQFQRGLLPTLPPERILGVRTPALRGLARELVREGMAEAFLAELPNAFFEEDQLHGFVVSDIKDFDECLAAIETFLPYLDNWATCDQTSPRAFFRAAERLLPAVDRWIASDHPYTVRFAIGMLMRHFLDERFDQALLRRVAAVKSEHYYVNMEIAWYFATALTKQWDAALPYLEERRLSPWVHRKTIQKAVESRCIPEDRKVYLKTLRDK